MTSIFVAKLDFGVTNDLLKETFQQYGKVIKATIALDKETGKSRGFGFIEMPDRDEAMNAIKSLDGFTLNGRSIAVKEAEQRSDNRPKREQNFSRNYEHRSVGNSSNTLSEDRTEKSSFSSKINTTDFTPPVLDSLKTEVRKKEKDKKQNDRDIVDGKAKKPKMSAYKKSGKNNRFFDDDSDDWESDLINYKSQDVEEDFEESDSFEEDEF